MATDNRSVREKIVQELMSRLKDAFPRVPIERGFVGAEVSQFPSIYIFEDVEAIEKQKGKAVYKKKLPITIEYFEKSNKPKDCYAEGNATVKALVTCIETDTSFGKLVMAYGLTQVNLALYKDNVVDTMVTYMFDYIEEFRGRGLSC